MPEVAGKSKVCGLGASALSDDVAVGLEDRCKRLIAGGKLYGQFASAASPAAYANGVQWLSKQC
jgi:hypothetical protein